MQVESGVESYEDFFARVEPRLRQLMTAMSGPNDGRVAALDALSYAWEHWDRISTMENPDGYVFTVARNQQRRRFRRRSAPPLPEVDRGRAPWVEPELPAALQALPEQQRTVVMLLHCFEWTMTEVADSLGVSKSTVQTHAERGLAQLRSRMGVEA